MPSYRLEKSGLDELKLQDPEIRRRLICIVQDATNQNESIGRLVERLKAVGALGVRPAENAEGLTPAGLFRRLVKKGTRS